MLTLVTTSTPDYGRPWIFPSLGMLHAARVVCLLHPQDARPLPRGAERHPYDTPGVLYQDGRFLAAVPGVADDDVVVLCDADGVFQRDFSAEELATFSDLGETDFALGYNTGPGQRGESEYHRLGPKQQPGEAARELGTSAHVLSGCWIYNTGFMAARAVAWRRLREAYAETFGHVDGSQFFALHSWPQLLICCLFSLYGFRVTELDYSTHSHGHCPLTPRHRIIRRQLYYDGRLVLYAHQVGGVSY